MVRVIGGRDGERDFLGGERGGGFVAEVEGDFAEGGAEGGGGRAGGAEDGEFMGQDGVLGHVDVGAVGGGEGGFYFRWSFGEGVFAAVGGGCHC